MLSVAALVLLGLLGPPTSALPRLPVVASTDGDCTKLILPTAAPVGTTSCPGIRPGGVVRSSKGSCTLNFLFRGSDNRRYIGTAGHCIIGEGATGADAGERTWGPGSGPAAFDASGKRIGEFAYAVLQDPKDFALVRLDSGVQSSAQICHFGGPTGMHAASSSAAAILQHYGNGLGTGETLPARSAVAPSLRNPDTAYALGAASLGDSGSPVTASDGKAVGVLVAVGVAGGTYQGSLTTGNVIITRLAPQLARASQRLGVSFTLLTASQL